MSVTLRPVIRLIIRGILISTFVVSIIFFTNGCGQNEERATPDIIVTPAAGGFVLPTAVNVPTSVPVAASVPVTESVLFVAGQTVQAAATLLLHADADLGALVMNRYPVGAQFTVLMPSGEYEAYPVGADDSSTWYRLRAADGLVGWVAANELRPMTESR